MYSSQILIKNRHSILLILLPFDSDTCFGSNNYPVITFESKARSRQQEKISSKFLTCFHHKMSSGVSGVFASAYVQKINDNQIRSDSLGCISSDKNNKKPHVTCFSDNRNIFEYISNWHPRPLFHISPNSLWKEESENKEIVQN